MNDRQLRMLRTIALYPCAAADFTGGDFGINARTAQAYLDAMREDGLIELQDGQYVITDDGRDEPGKAALTPARNYCNAAMTKPYTPPTWVPARPNADEHLAIQSRGVGA